MPLQEISSFGKCRDGSAPQTLRQLQPLKAWKTLLSLKIFSPYTMGSISHEADFLDALLDLRVVRVSRFFSDLKDDVFTDMFKVLCS